MKFKKLTFFTVLALTGCGTGQVIKTGVDTYSVTSSGAGFSTDGVKTDVYRAANEQCSKQNREMVEVSIKTQDGALGRNPPSADLTFKCLTQDDPEIKQRARGQPIVVIPASSISGEHTSTNDQLTALKQLKELLDSGALTQKEFDEQKAKILSH